MPQPKKGPRLGSGPKHQRLLLAGLASSLFEHERIKTTEAKAKVLRPFAEKLITKAKKGDVHNRRLVLAQIEDRDIVHKLFSDIGPRFAERNGGYTRILKLGARNGDGAPMVLIELVDEGADATTDETEEAPAARRRLGRTGRRKSSGTPQDKPVTSKAAQAAAAGTPGEGDVQPPPDAVADEAAAERAAAETAAADASESAAAADASSETADAQDSLSAGGADPKSEPKS